LSEHPPERPSPQAEDLQDLFDNAPCGYLSLAPDGRVILANRRIAAWTGHSASELEGRRIQDLLSVAGRIFYETNIAPLLRMQGYVDEVAMTFLTSDKSSIHCLVNASERRDAAGGLLFTRLAIFNAKERRRYERALVDSSEATEQAAAAERETSQLREQFIAVLGHDLRNPLASISSGVRLLADHETLSARGQHIVTLMQGSVMRASELIDNVLDFARGRLGGGITLSRDAEHPLSPVLEQVVEEIASISPGRKIETTLAIDERVDCDRTRLGQLLSNLLGNAITHGAKDQAVHVCAETRDGRFILSVANGGPAIPAGARANLFQPFFRGDRKPSRLGLGLGLHIASEIAKAHGGELTLSSNDVETRFTFVMALIRPDAVAG
jgi:sigma-B regulation protein RsbU (phosphoserine phosphatase)